MKTVDGAPGDVKSLSKRLNEDEISYVLAQFVDIHGVAKTKAVPVRHFESVLREGAGFAGFALDGTGLQPHGPDLMAVGDPGSYRSLPWMPGFARLSCDGHVNGEPYSFDSRVVCKRALQQLRDETGADLMTGLEPEFFIVRRSPATGELIPDAPDDSLAKPCYDYRAFNRSATIIREISDALIQSGVDVYQIDHEDANGQFEINFTYAGALRTADDFILVKMAASEIAYRHGAICSFMPKPFSDRSGSGMHMHLSISDGTSNLFHDPTDSQGLELSTMAYHFLGGLLAHAPALTAIACPSVNSYKRLISTGSRSGSTWAPTSVCYGDNNRSAMIRVPKGRLEIRVPDAGCNPYLLTAAVIGAGLDGLRRKLAPGPAFNQNLYLLTNEQKDAAGIRRLPDTLKSALAALREDQVIREALGEQLAAEFIELKTSEWDAYHRHVSDWELKRYLQFF